jgi:hypothetical protein
MGDVPMLVVMAVSYLLALLLVIGLGAATTAVNPRRRAAAARAFAAGAEVELTPPELAADVSRRLLRRDRFDVAGRVAGVLAIVPLGHLLGVGGLFFGLLAGLGGARALAALTEVRRPAGHGARVTHLLPPRLTDYVRPVAVWCVRVVVLLPVGLAVLWRIASSHSYLPPADVLSSARANGGLVLGTAAVALASWLVAELGARQLLRLRRVAGTPAELALDDAFRVSALRDLAVLPLAVGGFGSVLLAGEVEAAIVPDYIGLPWAAAAVTGTLAAVAIGVESVRSRRWRRRLHPELAPR